MNAADEQKRKLRRELSARRRAIQADRKRELDRMMTAALLELNEYKNARYVLCYVSTPDEPDTRTIIGDALRRGKTVCCPRCADMDGHMDFYIVTDLSQLREGAYSIMEPDAEQCERADTSAMGTDALCVVPGLSFDGRGMRLGYGKGYYDRFLAEFNGVSAGMCCSELLSDVLPTDCYDRAVDMIVTERGRLI